MLFLLYDNTYSFITLKSVNYIDPYQLYIFDIFRQKEKMTILAGLDSIPSLSGGYAEVFGEQATGRLFLMFRDSDNVFHWSHRFSSFSTIYLIYKVGRKQNKFFSNLIIESVRVCLKRINTHNLNCKIIGWGMVRRVGTNFLGGG